MYISEVASLYCEDFVKEIVYKIVCALMQL